MDEGQGIFVINNQEVEMKQFHSPQQNTKWNAERPRPSISCSGSSADNVMENLTSIPSENMKAEKYVVKVRVLGIREMKQTSNSVWRSSSRFMFVIELTWSNEDITFICRDHEELFTYHCWLLDTFTTEAGHNGSKRTIPLLPGKSVLIS